MAYRSILRPIASRIEPKGDLLSAKLGSRLIKKEEVPKRFSYESFLTTEVSSKATYEDFLVAAHEFGASAVEASGDDLRAYLTHLGFMCKMAATKKYNQDVHMAYDKAIRKQAEEFGWPAFKDKIVSIVKLHYGAENIEKLHAEVDKMESDNDDCACSFDDKDIDDEHQGNEKRIWSKPETVELQYEHSYATDNKKAEVKIPETDTVRQSHAVSKGPATMQVSEAQQSLAQGTLHTNIEYSIPDLEVPLVDKVTVRSPSKTQKAKMRSILKSNPSDKPNIASGESSGCSSVVLNDNSSKRQSAQTGEKRHICSHCGKEFPKAVVLKRHLRIHIVDAYETAQITGDKKLPGNKKVPVHQTTKRTPSKVKQKDEMCIFVSKRRYKKGPTAAVSNNSSTQISSVPSDESSARSPSLSKKRQSTFNPVKVPEKHICPKCGKQFPLAYSLKKHLKTHVKEIHICSYCGLKLSSANSHKAHLLRHTVGPKAKNYLCTQCGKGYTSLPDLHIHMRSHTGERPYSCPKCDKKFISKFNVRKHMITHSEEKQFMCSYCGSQFLTAGALRYHTRIHTGEKPFVCSYCGKGFRVSGHLRNHVRSHTGERPYICSECGKGLVSNSSLKKHKLCHTGEKPYNCTYCNKGFKQKRVLDEHIKIWHSHKQQASRDTSADTEGNARTCPECGKQFEYLASLKVHMITHTGGDPLTCPECGQRCIRDTSLRLHMLVHTQEKAFECPDCGKIFLRPGNLHRHQEIHHAPERSNICSFCSESFNEEADLQVHIKDLHTGDKPYLCLECGRRFAMPSYLRKHKKFLHAGTAIPELPSLTDKPLPVSEEPGGLLLCDQILLETI